MALYETVFIARQDLTIENVDTLSDKLSKIITDNKGSIVSKEYWGLRKLSYRIKKNSKGHYVLLNIDADYSAVSELKRVMSFNEDIIRNITLKALYQPEETPLFICKNAKDYKPGKLSKKDENKYDSILDQAQFDI